MAHAKNRDARQNLPQRPLAKCHEAHREELRRFVRDHANPLTGSTSLISTSIGRLGTRPTLAASLSLRTSCSLRQIAPVLMGTVDRPQASVVTVTTDEHPDTPDIRTPDIWTSP